MIWLICTLLALAVLWLLYPSQEKCPACGATDPLVHSNGADVFDCRKCGAHW